MISTERDLVERLRGNALVTYLDNGLIATIPPTNAPLLLEAADAICELRRTADAAETERDRMAKDWCEFCATVGVNVDTHEAVADALASIRAERDAAVTALKPFADFIGDCGDQLPDEMPLTGGSPFARKQVTVADFRRAARAIAGEQTQ